nr:hypothetical protein [Tanacetum cinerariifolium]
MLPIELTNDEIRNTKAYKEYYAFPTGEAAPKPKASARRKRSGSDTSITPPTATTTPTTTVVVTLKLTAAAKGKQLAKAKSPSNPSEVARTEAQQLKIILRRSRQQTHISLSGGSGADDQEKVGDDDEGNKGNDIEEGEEDDDDDEDKNGDERDDDDQDQEIAKHDHKDDTEESGDVDEEGKSDEEDDNEETRDEESFDPIPQTPESSEDEGDGEDDQGLRISEEKWLNEEEETEELYIDVNINQGRGIQATLDQESSSVSSHFVTSMLNPPSDAGTESIFATASSSVAPLQTSTPIMTPSTIATITTISHAPIPPTTISSEVLQNLPTFDSVFRFEDRLKSLEASFSEYIQTNPFAEAISNIPVNKDTSLCEIFNGPHETQYCMEDPEQAFIEYASSHTDEARGNPHDKPEEEEKKGEDNPKNTNTVQRKEEQKDTPQLKINDPAVIDKIRPSRDDKQVEWLDVEEPLNLVDTSEESVYESLIKEMPKFSLNYDFRIKEGDPQNLKIPCMIGHKSTANAYINVDLPMNVMSL